MQIQLGVGCDKCKTKLMTLLTLMSKQSVWILTAVQVLMLLYKDVLMEACAPLLKMLRKVIASMCLQVGVSVRQ